MVKRRSEKKGSKFGMLVPVIHQTWGSSNEEAPPCDPNKKVLTQKEWLKAISMRVAMETKDGLRRGAIMVVAKNVGLVCPEQKVHIS